MASCAFLRAHTALASGTRYLTASTIEPDFGCSGIGGSAIVGIAGVGPASIVGNAPASLPTRDGGGGSGSGICPDGSRVGLVGASDGDGALLRRRQQRRLGRHARRRRGAADRSDASAAPGAPSSARPRRRRLRRADFASVGRSSTMVAGACTAVCASSSSSSKSRTTGREPDLATSASDSGLVVRRSLSPCDAGCVELGISCAGMPSSVPVGAAGIGGAATSWVSSFSLYGLSVGALDGDDALPGPLVGTGRLTGGSVPGAAVGAKASGGGAAGAAVVGGASDGARGCGRGGTGRGAGRLRRRGRRPRGRHCATRGDACRSARTRGRRRGCLARKRDRTASPDEQS